MDMDWKTMLARSFDPREWFGRSRPNDDQPTWTYRREGDLFKVGYYDRDGRWRSDSSMPLTREEAAARARYLNTGEQFGMA
jgi:hypothetical protein